jgi:AcrR family transcriptional regulator
MPTQTLPVRTRPRMPAAERKAAIVDAAIELFSKNGFRGTTTRELAALVGVSEPVLYQHFATKSALWDAILEAKSNEMPPDTEKELEELSKAGDNPALFRRLAGILLDWYIRDPRYARLLMYSALDGHELSQLFYDRQVACFYEWLTAHLKREAKRGVFRKVDPLLAARSFAGMIAHHGTIYSIYRPGELAGSREAIVDTVVKIFLNGIKA